MTPAARVQAAIEVLDTWQGGRVGLDRCLTAWARSHRFAGSGDRRAIGDLCYDAMRRRLSAAWRVGVDAGAMDARKWMAGSLLLDGVDPCKLFTGEKFAPKRLSLNDTHLFRPDMEGAPRHVRLDMPEWMLDAAAGVPDAALGMLRERAPLDLRINRLRADKDTARASLAADGILVEKGPLVYDCLRVVARAHKVRSAEAYLSGKVEIQDAASQAVACLAAARPGETVLDLCAGGGGKTLAMAADMAGQGALYAHDINPARLAPLADRASRAGATVRLCDASGLAKLRGRCDLVLVDAPCSGSGAWRRNPDAKWRLTRSRLDELVHQQAELLIEARSFLRTGGRLIYATCSLFSSENFDQLDQCTGINVTRSKLLTPLDGGDGFFMAEILL